MNETVIIIPAYNPNKRLNKLINNLSNYKIIVVNDGSKKDKIFKYLSDNIIYLSYKENKGKGYAIKYAINYYLEFLKNDYKGVITVDADYQHLPVDIDKINYRLIGNQDSIILGSRNFDTKDTPKMNKFGNRLTSNIFKMFYGTYLKDTQTGLRGIPNRYLNLCLEIDGDRYEYEMNQLIEFNKKNINIIEENIDTVYYKDKSSSFKKIIDSIRIYRVLFTEYVKFIITSLIASLFDVMLFTIFNLSLVSINNSLNIFISTIFARIIADFINYYLTNYFVFDSREKAKDILFRYYLLSCIKMIISAIIVILLSSIISINSTILKVIVDLFIFFISYKVQKKYVFKTK